MARPFPFRILFTLAATLAATAALLDIAAGPGTRWGYWDYRTGFSLLRWGAWTGSAALLCCLWLLVWTGWKGTRKQAGMVLAVTLVAVLAFGGPWAMQRQGRLVPPIHDITTDIDEPPAFVALEQARRASPNGFDHGGSAVAAQQRAAYPDIAPKNFAGTPQEAFARARGAAAAMGWEVVAADENALRIEATDTTLLFGFKDDIVIRIRPAGAMARLDVRSVSRVGRSDLGTNARRVRRFLARVAAQG
jgi:uncharacterized protein (DUF1499 family)